MYKLITIEKELSNHCPNLTLGVIQCQISNTLFNAALWNEVTHETEKIRNQFAIEQVKNIPAIEATRQAYKNCGKDPNRYRPSSEQLNRRLLQGKDLYQISTVVDLINLVSLKSGYSIGGFDADKIQGNLTYGIGKADEIYSGIGRGLLNIERLPVLRDEIGGVGTPTSDEERTMLSLQTTSLLMNINGYDGKTEFLQANVQWSIELLMRHVDAHSFQVTYFQS